MYVPTILIDGHLLGRIQRGEVRIRCGQWVQLAWCDRPSRWVGTRTGDGAPYTVWAVHYQGGWEREQFKALAKARQSRPEEFLPVSTQQLLKYFHRGVRA